MVIEDTGTQGEGWMTHNGLFGELVRGLPERMEKLMFGEALCETASSSRGRAIALMNSQQVWLLFHDLYKTGPIVSSHVGGARASPPLPGESSNSYRVIREGMATFVRVVAAVKLSMFW